MILFKQIRYKNFLSSGNKDTTIALNESATTLIVGTNGTGKSTITDALSFALFGKAFRKITKPQLVNTINKKNCEVEVWFSVGSDEFRIFRGISPAKFEIYKNGVLMNQEANARDYQKILEQNILKMNYKSFRQVMILGSASFVPFMQLTSANRREVIEDLLDIGVFSRMNILVKSTLSTIKSDIKSSEQELAIISTKISSQQRNIEDLERLTDSVKIEKKASIKSSSDKIDVLMEKVQSLSDSIKHRSNQLEILTEKTEQRNKAKSSYETLKSKISDLVREVKFYDTNDHCPTCEQTIDEEFKADRISQSKNYAKNLSTEFSKCKDAIIKFEAEISDTKNVLEGIEEIQREIRTHQGSISQLQQSVAKLQQELLENKSVDLLKAKADLESMTLEQVEINQKLVGENEELKYNLAIAEMLKDDGIKTKIIKQYLPVINQLVNSYLKTLDFFVSFNLNDKFEEEIRSRYRDTFSYDSFSEGEKQRIDLSLLFTWRAIAKMKNSVSTNLLVLDETFDASLDNDGIENLLKILNTLDDNSNVFIISHKGDILEDKFQKKIEFVKHNNFSMMS